MTKMTHPIVKYFEHRFKLQRAETPIRIVPKQMVLPHISDSQDYLTIEQMVENLQRVQPIALDQLKDYTRLGEGELDGVYYDYVTAPLAKVICMFPGLERHPIQQRIEALGETCVLWQGSGYFENIQDTNAALAITLLNYKTGHYFIGPVDHNYLTVLVREKIPHALVIPSLEMRDIFRRMLAAQPGNNQHDVARFFDNWDKTIEFFEDHLAKNEDNGLVTRYTLSIRDKEIFVREIPAIFAVSRDDQYYKLALNEYGTGTMEIKLQTIQTAIIKPNRLNKKALREAAKKSRREVNAAHQKHTAQ